MKKTRILALVIAILMMASMPAMAEAKLHTVTIQDISIQQNADAATLLGLSLTLAGGGDGENAYVNASATGNGNPIVNAELAVNGGNVTLSMDGLTNNYAISKDDLQKLMEQGMDRAKSQDMPFDQQDVQELVALYIEAIQQAKEQGKIKMSGEELAAYYADAGFAVGGEESVTVNGTEMSLQRYDLDMDAQGMDKMIQASYERMPAMKAFMVKYAAFVDKVAAKSSETVTIDPEHMFSGLYGQLGMDIRVKATVWTDAKAENMRMEMEETVTENRPQPAETADAAQPEATREPVTVTVPMTMQVSTDERGQRVTMNMDMDQQGVQMSMLFKLNDSMLDAGAKGNFNFGMTVMGEQIDMTGDYNYDAAGKGGANFELNVPMGDGAVSRNSVQLKSTGGDVNTHSVQLRTMQLKKDGALVKELSRMTVSFNVVTAEGALEGAASGNGKPVVDIAAMTQEQKEAATEELMTKGIMAYGQLMATDGVAKLMTDLVMMANTMVQSTTTASSAAA